MTDHTDDLTTVGGVGLGIVPKQKRGIEVRNRLFDAAMKEFSEHGIAASRVERIVAEAGTSWGTFFRYFPRKEDVLLLAAARHFRDHVRPVMDRGLADPERSIRSIAHELFMETMTPRYPPVVHAELLAETQRYPPRFAAMLGEGDLPVIAMVTKLMEEAQKRGEIRSDVPAFTCATVLVPGVFFSTAPYVRMVAAGKAPASKIAEVASVAFDLAWDGLSGEPRNAGSDGGGEAREAESPAAHR
jgi:AcrR family transcriptional regulator